MGRGVDLMGKRFGNLVALRPTDQRDAHRNVLWECQCDCNKVILVSTSHLNRKNRPQESCGCIRHRTPGNRKGCHISEKQKLALIKARKGIPLSLGHRQKIARRLRKDRVRHSAGYWVVLVRDHPRACRHNKFGESYVYEHILIAEKALGRFLKKGEMVHHINGDKSDNRNCNLLICNGSYHRFITFRQANAYGKLCVPKKEE